MTVMCPLVVYNDYGVSIDIMTMVCPLVVYNDCDVSIGSI